MSGRHIAWTMPLLDLIDETITRHHVSQRRIADILGISPRALNMARQRGPSNTYSEAEAIRRIESLQRNQRETT